ncbi:MAG: CCA tRNA nucleotidyltransferase, partial [Parasphingorhabdus sp.]
ERVAAELLKLLQTEDPRFAVNQMLDAGIFDHIIREIDGDAGAQISRLVEREQRLAVAPTAIRRLVAILPKDVHKADAIAKDLKLSKKQQKAIGQRLSSGFTLAADNQANSRSIAYRTSVDAARDTALLFAGESALLDMLSQLKDWQPPTFPLTGGDLIKRGLKPGPVVAKTLATIETAWIAQGFPDETWIKKFVDEQEFPLHS